MSPLIAASVDGEPIPSPEALKLIAAAVDRLIILTVGHGVRFRLRPYRVKGEEQLAAVWYDSDGRQPIFSLSFVPAHWLPHHTDAWFESGINAAEIAVADITDSLLILERIVSQYEDRSGFAAVQIMSSAEAASA